MLARAENHQNRVIEQINLSLLLQQIALKYQAQIDNKSLILEVDIQSNLLVQGFTHSLDRVFMNLIENAIYYTPSNGKISILACQIERQIEIAIIDTGVGIAADDLERIFDRFWRGDRARTRWAGGSGLGLAIARSIVEQHHGSIEVQSQLGEGSTFAVRLPIIL
jgi:two-component system, OmpR family, manganese sensing sensor histidine kinase